MYTLIYALRAFRDLENIQNYGVKTYGLGKALQYSEKISNTITALLEDPYLGHYRKDIPDDSKAINVGVHTIVYKVVHKRIVIAAVLHSRMDFTAQLSS